MNWPTVRFGTVARQRKEFVTINDMREYMRCRVQLHAQGIVERDRLPGAMIKTKQQQECRAGEFLVAEIDAKHGGYGIVPDELDGAVVSSHYFLFEIDDSQLDRKFLGYFARTPAFLEQVNAQGTTNYAAIRPQQVLAYEIPLPPLAEQRRIVTKIERLAGKIEEARGLRETSTRLLSRFVTSQHLQLSSETHVALGEFLVLDEDRVLVTPGVSYPQVGVKAYGQGLFPKPAVAANDTTYTTFNRLYSGAVLLSQVKGWEGAIAVCGDQLSGWFVSPEYRTFRCIPSAADARYLRHVFATDWFWLQLKNLTRGLGGRRERIRPEQFLELTIPMPPVEQQTKSAELFDKLEPVRHIQGQTVAELDALLPAILDRAFKGEL